MTMKRWRLACGLIAGCLAACVSSPPSPPQPIEATRQSVNSGVQLELQTCEARLANTRLALEEAFRMGGPSVGPATDVKSSCGAGGTAPAAK